jgi:hypothetical protein
MTEIVDIAPSDHHPGGKVKLALPAGVHGDAVFTRDGRYRPLMRRWIGDRFPDRYAMFIGMNHSTADAEANDPTCAREWQFARREGFDAMVKANVGDYRATNPKDLLAPGLRVSSPENLPSIRQSAAGAGLVVLCHGKLNQPLAASAREIISALGEDGIELWCFGTNADGSPKHPLYLRADTPLVRFRPA